jgi:small subunit ribosomal protein S2
METNGEMSKLPRKEESAIKREMTRMQRNFNGIVDMGGLPAALFVVDINHEAIAVAEAKRCGIPCIALVDTNSDPTQVSHPIPGNDDAVKSIRIIVETIVAAIQRGLALRDTRRAQRGQADIRGQQAPVAAEVTSPTGAEAGALPISDEIDLSKVDLPADVAAVVEGDTDLVAAAKRKAVRPRKALVKAE